MNNIPPNHDGHGPDLEKANNNHVGNSCSISLDENEVRKKVRFFALMLFIHSLASVLSHRLLQQLWNFDRFLRLQKISSQFEFGCMS